MGLFDRWDRWREKRALARRAIPDEMWRSTLDRYHFLQQRSDADLERLRRMSAVFLDTKEFAGANGFLITDEVAVAVAAQACLPVLHLGLHLYDGFVGIVMQPGEVVARRQQVDEAGVVHAYDEVLVGEAMDGGPVMLSWPDVAHAGESATQGHNVVIHEFVHKLDMGDGEANGIPPMPGQARQAWADALTASWKTLCRAVDLDQDTFLDPYAAQGPEEFFAVAAEAFFVAPQPFAQAHPELYGLFATYFRQDPARGIPQRPSD